SSNRDEGCLCNLTPSRRFYDRGMTLSQAERPWGLTLPVADAARFAGPDLNPRIARLGVERIAMPPRQFGASGGTRPLGLRLRNPGGLDPRGPDSDLAIGFRFRLGLCALG